MTFIVKQRGAAPRIVVAEYECPVHGRFAVDVERDEHGDPPESIACPILCDVCGRYEHPCGAPAEWRISAPAVRVARFSVVRGGWAKPERKTWLDTRELGEGQSMEEFRAKRAGIREDQRQREMMELKKRGDL